LEEVRLVKLRYSEDAIRHIDAIHAYIAERNPIAATRVVERIRVAAERLLPFPEMALAGVVPNAREWWSGGSHTSLFMRSTG
jgi:toxin ParE1/3/4